MASVEHRAAHEDRASVLTGARCRPAPLRVLVCGSRDWLDFATLCREVARFPRGTTIVHGGAPGADAMANRVAALHGYSVDRFPANWKHHGKAAGFIRNVAMLDSGVDRVLAFHRNGSRGTQHTITEARKRGIPVEVFTA